VSRRAVLPAALVLALVASIAAGAGTSHGAARLKVAYVTDFGARPSPHDLRGAALLGFRRAVGRFRVQARVAEFPPAQDAGPTLEQLAGQRYDLIMIGEVRSGFDLERVLAVARRFPHTKFVLADPPLLERWPKNVQGSIWHVEQPAYLAGYLSALMVRRGGRKAVGSVGGFPIVSVNSFIAGFDAGAKSADPKIATLRAYAQDFLNADKCKSVALNEIARGAGALLNVAGLCGLGTLAAAKTKGVWGIGVDVDQSFLGPYVLTSVLKRFDVQVYDTVQALVQGRLRTGGNAVWDLRNGAVGLGKVSPEVPKSVVRRIDLVRARIAAGTIQVPSRLVS